ncbi:MAG TPA: hypothetical protein VFG68_22385 [Fimbriiglobus sp.]|nr:hypothetical protein [Fimbriiglobus sp.]
MVPFCDPVGWVESFGPVLGPILAALSLIAYPVYLIYYSYLLGSIGQAVGNGIGLLAGLAIEAIVYGIVIAVLVAAAVVVGAVFLVCLAVIVFVVIRRLLEPAPINEPWIPRRWPGRSTQVG